MAVDASDSTLTAEGEQRRQEVLDRAAELFARQGFDGTTINDIAAATTIKKASLYHYFPSKQSILEAILEDGLELFWRDAREAATIDDPVERIHGLVTAQLKNFGNRLPHLILFMREHNALKEQLAESILRMRREHHAFYVHAIQEGQKLDIFRQDDPEVMAMAVMGMINWMIDWYDPTAPLKLDSISGVIHRCALSALN